jgi:hypothetical protein
VNSSLHACSTILTLKSQHVRCTCRHCPHKLEKCMHEALNVEEDLQMWTLTGYPPKPQGLPSTSRSGASVFNSSVLLPLADGAFEGARSNEPSSYMEHMPSVASSEPNGQQDLFASHCPLPVQTIPLWQGALSPPASAVIQQAALVSTADTSCCPDTVTCCSFALSATHRSAD